MLFTTSLRVAVRLALVNRKKQQMVLLKIKAHLFFFRILSLKHYIIVIDTRTMKATGN